MQRSCDVDGAPLRPHRCAARRGANATFVQHCKSHTATPGRRPYVLAGQLVTGTPAMDVDHEAPALEDGVDFEAHELEGGEEYAALTLEVAVDYETGTLESGVDYSGRWSTRRNPRWK